MLFFKRLRSGSEVRIMLKLMTNNILKYSYIIGVFLCFPALVNAGQDDFLVIENSNNAYMHCMADEPVIKAITQCSDASACWAIWLEQYKKAMSHKLACIKLHGGIENRYYYTKSVKYEALVVN